MVNVLVAVVPLIGQKIAGVTMKTTIVDVDGMVELVVDLVYWQIIAKNVHALIQAKLLDVKLFKTFIWDTRS